MKPGGLWLTDAPLPPTCIQPIDLQRKSSEDYQVREKDGEKGQTNRLDYLYEIKYQQDILNEVRSRPGSLKDFQTSKP